MNKMKKEFIIGGMLLLLMVTAGLSFFSYMKSEKEMDKIDLFTCVSPGCKTIWCVNNTGLFKEMLKVPLAESILSAAFSSEWVSLLKQYPTGKSILLASCDQDVLLYGKVTPREAEELTQTLFNPLSSFLPHKETLNGGIVASFYALAGKRFFGYYLYKGVLVAGYSRKLLEKSAVQLIAANDGKGTAAPWEAQSRKMNRSVPANLLFPLASLNLYEVTDSVSYPLPNSWLAADVYCEKQSLCCFGSLPDPHLPDSLYSRLSTQISLRMEALFPPFKATTTLKSDGNLLYYSIYENQSHSTTNPSYE